MTKPLIVGEAPSKQGAKPIAGTCGRRLATFAGSSLEQFLETFDRVNVLPVRPPVNGARSDSFPMREARLRAEKIKRGLGNRKTVIVLGRRAARAFGVSVDYFKPVQVGKAEVVVVPHPSGLNRWYNEEANKAKMKKFMRALARRAKTE